MTGEPGIGKTTLVDAFVAGLGQGGPVWIGRGQCVEQYGAGEPYLPLLDALGGLCAGPAAEELVTRLRRHAPSWLAQLPALLGAAERDALRRQVQGVTRARMLRELADLVDALATARPLVWVLEDLHWSDTSTVEALSVATALFEDIAHVETVCDALAQRGQFLEDRGVAEWPDGTTSGEYQFRHALYQTALYRRIGSGRQTRLHRALGMQLEGAYGVRAPEMATELTLHFERGRDLGRAVTYRQQAAANALQRWAYPEALEHLLKGLELLKTRPDAPERRDQELGLQVLLGDALVVTQGPASPDVARVFARARELCRPGGDPGQLFTTVRGQWISQAARGQLLTARGLGGELLALAQRQQDAGFLVEAHRALASTSFYLGELAAARVHAAQGLALYHPQQQRALAVRHGQDPGVACLVLAAYAMWHLGYADQALASNRQALNLARELSHAHGEAQALFSLAVLHQLRREAPATHAEAEAAVKLSAELGFAFYSACGTVVHGWALATQGHMEEGIRQIRRGLIAYETTGAEVHRTYFLAQLAEVHERLGQADEGLSVLAEALELVEKNEERVWEAEIYRLQGELTLQQIGIGYPGSAVPTDPESSRVPRSPRTRSAGSRSGARRGPNTRQAEAEACFHRAIEVARRQAAKSLELRAVMSLSRLWRLQDRRAEARETLAAV